MRFVDLLSGPAHLKLSYRKSRKGGDLPVSQTTSWLASSRWNNLPRLRPRTQPTDNSSMKKGNYRDVESSVVLFEDTSYFKHVARVSPPLISGEGFLNRRRGDGKPGWLHVAASISSKVDKSRLHCARSHSNYLPSNYYTVRAQIVSRLTGWRDREESRLVAECS